MARRAAEQGYKMEVRARTRLGATLLQPPVMLTVGFVSGCVLAAAVLYGVIG